jgi:hypothetical protein
LICTSSKYLDNRHSGKMYCSGGRSFETPNSRALEARSTGQAPNDYPLVTTPIPMNLGVKRKGIAPEMFVKE